jgi:hypothetical protein
VYIYSRSSHIALLSSFVVISSLKKCMYPACQPGKRKVTHMCARGIHFSCFRDFCIWFWNSLGSLIFFSFRLIKPFLGNWFHSLQFALFCTTFTYTYVILFLALPLSTIDGSNLWISGSVNLFSCYYYSSFVIWISWKEIIYIRKITVAKNMTVCQWISRSWHT